MNLVLVADLNRRPAGNELKKEIQKTAGRILKILKKDNISVEIYLADSRKMRFLNKKFRGKDKIANILSFEEPKNFVSAPSKAKKIGEIYLKVPIIDYSVNQLIVHGLLHLFGYTHKKKGDTIKMEKKENYVHNRLRHRFVQY